MSRVFLAVVLLLVLASGLFASEDDWSLWTGYKVKAGLSEDVGVFVSAELRWKDNWDKWYYERYNLGLSFKIADHWKVEPFYSTARAKLPGGWDNSDLFSTDVIFSMPIESLGIDFENRVRVEKNFASEREAGRNRVKFSKKIPAFGGSKVHVSDDIIYSFSAGDFKQNRLAAGITKGFPCGTSFGVAYQFTSTRIAGSWDDSDVLLVNIGYTPPK